VGTGLYVNLIYSLHSSIEVSIDKLLEDPIYTKFVEAYLLGNLAWPDFIPRHRARRDAIAPVAIIPASRIISEFEDRERDLDEPINPLAGDVSRPALH
jgi:hypothetical protein